VLVALWALWIFREQLHSAVGLKAQALTSFAVLAIGFAAAGQFTSLAEAHLYADEIVHSETSPYQRLVITRWKDDLRLFLNNNLQFSSRDEYRYHEALVHPGLATLPGARRVLVLGGGDGLAVREILKYPQIESVTLVDLDPAMTRLFSTAAPLRKLNEESLSASRVRVINADALKWLEEHDELFDFIVVDFPDPSNFAIGKLYSAAFYRLLEKHMTAGALAVIQSTSPLYARQSFWCVATTLESVGFVTTPYHALVPSFGEWGFVLAGRRAYKPPASYAVTTRFLSAETTPALFQFPKDMARVPAEVNRLNNQVLVRYFEAEWRQVIR
jgi:spermidine synthase